MSQQKTRHPTQRRSLKTMRAGIRLKTGGRYKFVVQREPTLKDARWLDLQSGEELKHARSGKTLRLEACFSGPASGTPRFKIFEQDHDSADDPVATIEGKLDDGKAAAEWTYCYVDDQDEEGAEAAYTKPELYFVCELGAQHARSPLLDFQDFVELRCVDPLTRLPRKGLGYTLTFPDGTTSKTGVLDEQGSTRVDGVPPGRYGVRFGGPVANGLPGLGSARQTLTLPAWQSTETTAGAAASNERGQLRNPRWLDLKSGEALQHARSGRDLKLSVETGTLQGSVRFRLFEQDKDSADDPVATLEAEAQNGRAEIEWAYSYVDDEDEEGTAQPYTKPELYFVAELGEETVRSALLHFQDFVELRCHDPLTKLPREGLAYTLILPDGGDQRRGTLDEQGRARVDGVPPGRYQVVFAAA